MCLLSVLAACAQPNPDGSPYDPYVTKNRQIHEANRDIDRRSIKPLSNAYGKVLPEPVRIGVSNFAANLSLPGTVLNDLLQLQLGDALHNTARFVINTTLGLGGMLDPAQDGGIEPRPADFGETLHVWGVGEGAYLELPLVGPSTSRDAVGTFVDFFIDPLSFVLPRPEYYLVPASKVASRLGDRYRFSDTVDSILYDSADSYLQSQLLYLENRRYELGQTVGTGGDLYQGLYNDLIPQ